ncbi:MAG: CHAD domain-containing protein [Chloroflexota bacterium]
MFDSNLSDEDREKLARLAVQEAGMHPTLFLPSDKPGLQSDDSMAEAGRKVLAYYFARMQEQEAPVREGQQNKDAIHDMRVATRRLRSALDIFGGFYRTSALRPFAKELRKVARSLGAVRDLEVVRAKAEDHAATSSSVEADLNDQGFQALLKNWQEQFDAATTDLIETLDSHQYAEFLADFAQFVTNPGKAALEMADKAQPHLVCHVAPLLIYERYEAVRAYETVLDNAPLDTLHALRIAAKGLRYTLEAFTEILQPEAKSVISAAKAIQDHLGELQDARVAVDLMHDFIAASRETSKTHQHQPIAGVLSYMAIRESDKQELLNTFAQGWEAFTHPDIRRALALTVSVL